MELLAFGQNLANVPHYIYLVYTHICVYIYINIYIYMHCALLFHICIYSILQRKLSPSLKQGHPSMQGQEQNSDQKPEFTLCLQQQSQFG